MPYFVRPGLLTLHIVVYITYICSNYFFVPFLSSLLPVAQWSLCSDLVWSVCKARCFRYAYFLASIICAMLSSHIRRPQFSIFKSCTQCFQCRLVHDNSDVMPLLIYIITIITLGCLLWKLTAASGTGVVYYLLGVDVLLKFVWGTGALWVPFPLSTGNTNLLCEERMVILNVTFSKWSLRPFTFSLLSPKLPIIDFTFRWVSNMCIEIPSYYYIICLCTIW